MIPLVSIVGPLAQSGALSTIENIRPPLMTTHPLSSTLSGVTITPDRTRSCALAGPTKNRTSRKKKSLGSEAETRILTSKMQRVGTRARRYSDANADERFFDSPLGPAPLVGRPVGEKLRTAS